jgi:hypothetical protein
LTLVNPTSSFRFCLHKVFIDTAEIELREQRRMPFCLSPQTKYPLLFSVFMQEHRSNRFLRATLFMQIQLNDTKTNKLVDNKVWTK